MSACCLGQAFCATGQARDDGKECLAACSDDRGWHVLDGWLR